jgi:UDP-N-acetylmuramoyl-tripeptide--D-alanyl-D-alanine ligase
MPQLIAESVAEICGGRLIGDGTRTATSVVRDSREVAAGVAFVSVRGDDFIVEAIDRGAPFVIVEGADRLPRDVPAAIVVENAVDALGSLARHVRRGSPMKVVAVTGSTGKTLTKDLIAAVLGAKYKVHAAPNSYNAELGVPLVVLGCPDDAEVLVAELAARHTGEIAYLADIVRPQTGVVTGIGITHIAEFGSRDAIARTKAELPAALPADGLAVLPSGDDYLALLAASTQARIRTVGPGASVRYHADRIDGDGRTHGCVAIDGKTMDVSLAVPGRPLLRNVAMALAVGVEYGIDPDDGARAIADAHLSSWRMQIEAIGPWRVVNDAWNSSPTSIASGLHATKEMAANRPVWAVLGGMAELGEGGPAEHVRAGRLAAALGYEGLILVGDAGAAFARGADAISHLVADKEEAAERVVEVVPSGAHVLVKASRSFGLEHFPDILKAQLDHAPFDRKA